MIAHTTTRQLGIAAARQELSKLPAFARRDFLFAWSYRVAFFSDWIGLAVQAVLFSFVGRLAKQSALPSFNGHQTSYMAFAMVGVAIGVFLQLGLDQIATGMRQEQLMGTLEPLLTFTTGFTIVPFVGALEADPVFTANPGEIAEVLEFPVSRLLEVERPMSWEKNGSTWWGYVCELDGHTIWGATGRILHEFLELLRKELA